MIRKKSVLITGANGFLGAWVYSDFLRKGWKVTGLVRRKVSDFPFTQRVLPDWNEASLYTFLSELEPNVLINTAAQSNSAEAELKPEQTWFANTEIPKILATVTQKLSIRLVHCSTDLIFDGHKGNYSESDPVNPQHVYGKSKSEAERLIPQLNSDSLIFRLPLLIGFSWDGNHGFLDSFRKSLELGKPQSAFTDEFRTPVPVSVAAKLISDSVTHQIEAGIYHLASDEKLSRFELACLLAEKLGFPIDLIIPAELSSFTGKPTRQPDVSMSNQKLKSALGISEILGISSKETFRKILI